MKTVVSVSLGSSSRDHEARATFLGEEFLLKRLGTDGDFRKAQALLRELDGTVDAIGLGGVDVYLSARGKRYALRDGLRLLQTVEKTRVVDGSGLKDTLEREMVRQLPDLAGKKVLMVCAMDRFGMAEALEEAGARCVYADKLFALNLDQPIDSLDELAVQAEKLLPEICKLPISFVYPTGKSQATIEPTPLTTPYYEKADVIAGDFHFIRRRLPDRLEGKTVLTNTVTSADIEELRKRGVTRLITTTPELEGRSFGTNVMEAVMLVLLGKSWDDVVPQDYLNLIQKMGLRPRVVDL